MNLREAMKEPFVGLVDYVRRFFVRENIKPVIQVGILIVIAFVPLVYSLWRLTLTFSTSIFTEYEMLPFLGSFLWMFYVMVVFNKWDGKTY